eukprot:COSAG03_NODE_173_length_11167_cov_181.916697_10_plen_77_part_00
MLEWNACRSERPELGGGPENTIGLFSMAPALRIAVGRLWQESNDLSTAPTTADDWRANGVLRGDQIAALAGECGRA